jgi:hypothetical protein
MYKNILVPTDGSELAWKAILHGANLAKHSPYCADHASQGFRMGAGVFAKFPQRG